MTIPDKSVILGIETSCDETAAAVVVDGVMVHSNVISSQIALHRDHGGVVPELAARGQITAIMPVVTTAMEEGGVAAGDIDAIAVTHGPGLAGSLLVGVNTAKALAMSWGVPLVPVNHLEAHVYANWLRLEGDERAVPEFPVVALLVSGGHTALILIQDHESAILLGETLDDAAGEAFDKGARLLGLGYPGGPAIQQLAADGDPAAIDLPRSWLDGSLDFSFSGLKTSLLRNAQGWRVPDERRDLPEGTVFPPHTPPRFRDEFPVADFAASFQEAIIDVLVTKAVWALERTDARSLVLAGGVAANRSLRERIAARVGNTFGDGGPAVSWPDLSLCTDNAAMIAGLARHRRPLDVGEALALDAYPRLAFGADVRAASEPSSQGNEVITSAATPYRRSRSGRPCVGPLVGEVLAAGTRIVVPVSSGFPHHNMAGPDVAVIGVGRRLKPGRHRVGRYGLVEDGNAMLEATVAEAHEVAISLAREAGALLRERFDDPRDVDHKGTIDLVTDADRASEAVIAETIRDRFPDHQLLAEEGATGASEHGSWRWVVDPLDGTTNFAHGYPHFAVSIALEYGDEVVVGVVYDPMRDELFEATRSEGARLNGQSIVVTSRAALLSTLLATGFPYDLSARDESSRLWARFNNQSQGVRRDGAASLNLCYVAAGRLDGYWERPVQPWDKAAGALIAMEAGALVTGLTGAPFEVGDDGVIAANPELHRAMLGEIRAELGISS